MSFFLGYPSYCSKIDKLDFFKSLTIDNLSGEMILKIMV